MGKSSKDKRDAYYRLAKEQGWRARSAFKLIQLDEQFDLFKDVSRVVDLCAAPGSWSQVLSRVLIKGESFGRRAWLDLQRRDARLAKGEVLSEEELKQSAELRPRKDVRIVSIDLQPMSPLEGITTLVGDITHPSTPPRILKALDPDLDTANAGGNPNPVDLVLSDGAPDVTGLHDLDIYVQSQLLFSALNLAIRILRPGGSFVAKIFRVKDVDLIYAQLKCFFKSVHCAKPKSSRASSLEAFIVCQGFSMPPGYDLDPKKALGRRDSPLPKIENLQIRDDQRSFVDGQRRTLREDGVMVIELEEEKTNPPRSIANFISCGDISVFDFDSDATYHLPEGHVSLPPVQPPTAPPYKRALEQRRKDGGFYGKTKNG